MIIHTFNPYRLINADTVPYTLKYKMTIFDSVSYCKTKR